MPRDFNICFYNFLLGQTNQYSIPTNVIYYFSIAASDDEIKPLDFNDNHDHLPKQKDSPKVIAQKIMEQRKHRPKHRFWMDAITLKYLTLNEPLSRRPFNFHFY